MKKWNSFTVKSPTEIIHNVSHPMNHHRRSIILECYDYQYSQRSRLASASLADTNTRAIFLLAAKQPPYNVYGNPFYDYAGHGNVFSVDSDGNLKENIQNYEYQPNSGIHGMVFDPTETYLYSADLRANKLWTHKKDSETGKLELVGSVDAPASNDHPRWVEMHPSGKYLYALMEAGNRLCVYVIDERTHLPVYTHAAYPLVPPGMMDINPKMYRADVVFLTQSGKYLFATARSNSPNLTGYIAAFKVSDTGSIERQICLNPTPTSGGHSNAVSPCPWNDEFLALCDDEKGWIEIYRWHDEFLGRVAHCDVKEPGFGMNAIWYD